VFSQPEFPAHSLLDSGGGEKLERYGDVVLRRPDPQALWRPRRSAAEWARAHLAFERDAGSGGKRGRWIAAPDAPPIAHGAPGDEPSWPVAWRDVTCLVRPTPFKHVGLFPEQAANWDFVESMATVLGEERPRLLNLFGYTGVASVVAARAGYEVTHVDASRTSLAWTRENAMASGLGEDALRIVLDDAPAFARREARRGAVYHGILMDPPHHGKGPKGERWQFEELAVALIDACRELLAPRGFAVLSSYAFGTSPLALEGLLAGLGEGAIDAGELALEEEDGGRRLPCGFCARFRRGLDG
jgi:23S rRNA (cytosine1962-C5)-methyltransferase